MKKIIMSLLGLFMTVPSHADGKFILVEKEYEKGGEYEPDYIHLTYKVDVPLNVMVSYEYDIDLNEQNLGLKFLKEDISIVKDISTQRYVVMDDEHHFIQQLKLEDITVKYPCKLEGKALVGIDKIFMSSNANTTDSDGSVLLKSIQLLEPLEKVCPE